MPKIVALFNQAGGVGKTTTTQNLGFHLSKRHRVLLIDIDPQASLTTFMGLEPADLQKTIYNTLMADEPQPMPLTIGIHGMDFVPANIDLAQAEQELIFAEAREFRLKEAIAPVVSDYDFILIDCPPSLGILSFISLVAATHVLVPIECQYKALKGADFLLKTIFRIQRRLNTQLKIAGFLPTMYQSTNNLDKATYKAMREQLSGLAPVFTPFPRATAVASAAASGKPLALSPYKNSALERLFDDLAEAMEAL